MRGAAGGGSLTRREVSQEEASPPGFVRTRWITFLAMFVG